MTRQLPDEALGLTAQRTKNGHGEGDETHGRRAGGVVEVLAGCLAGLKLGVPSKRCVSRVVVSDEGGSCGVQSLHINDGEANSAETYEDNVWPVVDKAAVLLIPTIQVGTITLALGKDTCRTEDMVEQIHKLMEHGIMYGGVEAQTMGTGNEVTTIRPARGRATHACTNARRISHGAVVGRS